MSEVMDLETPVQTQEDLVASMREGFPFGDIRPTQTATFGAVAKSRIENKRFTIAELPTGTGKSACSIAVADYSRRLTSKDLTKSPGAYILTSQKTLQQQLMNDFSKLGLVELKGKNNYGCIGAPSPTDCETYSSVSGKTCDGCPYRVAKETFSQSPMGVTNYSYMAHERLFSSELPEREYLICDEGHNIEKEILNLVDIRITPGRCEEMGVFEKPPFEAGQETAVISWLDTKLLPPLRTLILELRTQININESVPGSDAHQNAELKKKYSALNGFLGRIEMFTETKSPDEWVTWTDEDSNLLIKPLTGSMFADDFLFNGAKSVVIMSATILDFNTFRRNLGIAKEDSVCMRVASEFPVENRKIVFWPTGSMSYKDISATLPIMAVRIENLLKNRFGTVKGIIHTHTYKIAEKIVEHLRSAGIGMRVITHTNLPGDRERAIIQHYADPGPSVLISPSMTEGLDLKDDLSRFQIICKVPYPYIDPYTKVRMERDPDWYQLQTALPLIQASGRSNRSMDDWATTVILDSNFGTFLSRNEQILPKWWRAAITTK
jgi:ATP-dependent DNA helicase DinG